MLLSSDAKVTFLGVQQQRAIHFWHTANARHVKFWRPSIIFWCQGIQDAH